GAGADDARAVPEGLVERLSEGESAVFDRVVLVDMEVAGGMDGEVKDAVFGDVAEHVIEEADARLHFEAAAAIQVEGDFDAGLGGLAGDGGLAAHAASRARS